ncbi:Glyoxalase/bleomycin resistance protein/dioxygenase [Kribbella flavida DSM 17836]|uniref:Glyoxalase/bleomycin resistance protein/dioxygenase n=1 Tax=Kribbella flavida (strain DSM 17836 / JCM 10339 / NBRC 14399) TaxID=479435 RepID=D2PU12_KRIFD|nr:VOC family protein [Kribbella flavida]ADB33295.1 Glyoxalase/bleomycin resistance protein/dioxygenase [Kribbella flavida DSM 17836]
MTKQSASASVEVAADPATAFRIFTDEIDLWWVRGPINFFDAARAVAMQIEPGVGGRILEVYRPAGDPAGEDVLELGRITAWEPGARLAYRSSVDDTETDIRFEAFSGGTRVSVEQTLVPGGESAFYFWPNVIPWFVGWVTRRDLRTPRELDRLSVVLYYEDPAAAARWLHTVFGLGSWDRIPAEGEQPSWIELHIGLSAVLLFKLEEGATVPRPVDHGVWVYVDDLDAHFARSSEQGAKIVSEIHQHGYRCYEVDDLEGHRWTFAQARPTMQ